MTKQEAMESFVEEIKPVLTEARQNFYQNAQAKAEELSQVLCDVIHKLRLEMVRLQKEKIMFIHFSLLRVGLEKNIYQVLAQGMDARWYLDTEPAEVEFDLNFLFSMWGNVRQTLIESSRKYLGKVNRYDVEHQLAAAIMECNSMLAQLLRFMFRDIEENPDFIEMDKWNTWGIFWGEYRDKTERIAYVNREKKEQLDWERALRQTKNDETSMVESFWYQAELKHSDCKGKQLYFVQFEECVLENISFDNAILTGARFKNCQIRHCSFCNATIHQGEFSGCSWEENTFKGADMLHSVFMENELPFIHLEPEQLQVILVDRGQWQ